MKNKKYLLALGFLVLNSIILFGCSEDQKKIQGDVILHVQNYDTYKSVHLEKIFTFIEEVNMKRKSEISIAIEDKNNVKLNKLNFDGKIINFTNNYEGFGTKKGTYQCKEIESDNMAVYVHNCKGTNDMLIVSSSSTTDMRNAKAKAK